MGAIGATTGVVAGGAVVSGGLVVMSWTGQPERLSATAKSLTFLYLKPRKIEKPLARNETFAPLHFLYLLKIMNHKFWGEPFIFQSTCRFSPVNMAAGAKQAHDKLIKFVIP